MKQLLKDIQHNKLLWLLAFVPVVFAAQKLSSMTGHHPWLVGIAMVALGSILVGMTMALGG